MAINKVILPYKGKTCGGRWFNCFVKIEYENERLSMHGVEGPLQSGNCLGSCGQIGMGYNQEDYIPADGWTRSMIDQLMFIWNLYHLNDLQANCIHQRLANITYESNPDHICPICNYKIGSKWFMVPVPNDVLEILVNYPESPVDPAWV